MDPSYNDKIDFINRASKQLESKLAQENIKLHTELMKKDPIVLPIRSTSSQFDADNVNRSSHSFETYSSNTESIPAARPAESSRPAPPHTYSTGNEYFRGPTTRQIPPANGIGGSITKWEWGTEKSAESRR